jgi:hypothetical protein
VDISIGIGNKLWNTGCVIKPINID